MNSTYKTGVISGCYHIYKYIYIVAGTCICTCIWTCTCKRKCIHVYVHVYIFHLQRRTLLHIHNQSP